MAGSLPLSPPIEWHDRLDSTQDLAHQLASAGAAHGRAVAAREQLRGRGTRGRSWASPRGGLWISVICRPHGNTTPESFAVRLGLAVARTLELEHTREPIVLKWPNDLYARDRKLGGLLCEARWQGEELAWIVVGLGLNVANSLAPELQGRAIALRDLGWRETPAQLAPLLVRAIAVAGVHGGALTPDELAAFRERDWLRSKRLLTPVTGWAEGITPEGRLRVVGLDGREEEVLGTVTIEGEG